MFRCSFLHWGTATKILLPELITTHQGIADFQCLEGFYCHLQGVPQRPLPSSPQRQLSVPPIQLWCWKSPAPSSLLGLLPGPTCVHTDTSESHHIQSWGTDQPEIQFSWLFFTWIQLPTGFTKHSHECLYWNIVGSNWTWDKAAGRGWEGIKWLQTWGLVFSASPPVWKSSNSLIKKFNRKQLTFQIKIGGFLKISPSAQLTGDLWKDNIRCKIQILGTTW